MSAITLGSVLKHEILKLVDRHIFSPSNTHTHTELIFFYNKTTFYLQD